MNENTINNDVTIAGQTSVLAGRYRILKQLGAGGMGSVWLAEDTQLDGKLFAIKMLPSILVANKRAFNQLKSEALVAMKLTHPNIVTLRAFEENNGNPFLVMDYIDGQTLDDWLGERGAGRASVLASLSEEEVVRLLQPIAEALDYAHTEGVVHRDVKPANVMIRKDGRPFIMDFGIAREIQETMTRVTGKLSSGTLLYMSPEQLNGASPKPAQDVYSFAAMVYECLKGEPPFCRGAIEDQIKNKTPEPLPRPVAIAASVKRGLEKNPVGRPPNCVAVLSQEGVEDDAHPPCDAFVSPHAKGGTAASELPDWRQTASLLKIENPIIPDSPLPNLDVSRHKIRRKGAYGFGVLLGSVGAVLLGMSGVALLVAAYDYYPYYREYTQEAAELRMASSAIKNDELTVKIADSSGMANHYKAEMIYSFLIGSALCIGCCFIGFSWRRSLFKRTQQLLLAFSQGFWHRAMSTKNVYRGDPFVLYYLGVGHLYIRQDYGKAEKLFSLAAESGVPEALIGLGWMAENGWGMVKNKPFAQRLYNEAKLRMKED